MAIRWAIVGFLTVMLAGCGDDVPDVKDPHNIVIDGVPMKQSDFLLKYCKGKGLASELANGTCDKVRTAAQMDSTRGEIPRFGANKK